MFTGKRVGRVRSRRARQREPRVGFWTRWVGLIQRWPVWAALGSTALLLALASPALGLRLGRATRQRPHHADDPACVRPARRRLRPGFNGPLQLAVSLPSAGDTGGLARFTPR
jgi:RND superfamily putative drug exporter